MAKVELKFLDAISSDTDFIKADIIDTSDEVMKYVISISGISEDEEFKIWLDKSTAIRFAKTLRTEINKIK